jgi:hypothetical protein
MMNSQSTKKAARRRKVTRALSPVRQPGDHRSVDLARVHIGRRRISDGRPLAASNFRQRSSVPALSKTGQARVAGL